MHLLHIVRNTVTHDSRVLKETGVILERFPERNLVIAGFHDQGYAEQELICNRQVHRWRLKTSPLPKDLFSQAIKFFEWRYRLVSAYMKEPLQVIHCHDLEPLPIAVKLKKLTGAKLIYDAHELETERKGGHGIRKRLSQWQENRLMPFVDHLITVSPSIRDWYAQRYPSTPISLVRNIPQHIDTNTAAKPLRAALGVPDDALLFLYLGGIGKGRGVEAILEGFASQGVKHHVLFMGSGPLLQQVKNYAKQCSRIHFQPPVPPSEVIAYARGADVGLCLYEDTCLNHRFCLPNKLFESLLSGLPVLSSNLPDQAKIVTDHEAGWVIEPNAAALEDFLQRLEASSARQLRIGLADRAADLRWENEAKALLEVYEGLGT